MTRSDSAAENELSTTTTTLRKGATFHNPATSVDSPFTPPQLPRAQSNYDDCVDARRRRMATTLNDIDEALSMTEKLSLSDSKPTRKIALKDHSALPLPRGFLELPVVDPEMAERRVLRPRSARRQQHASDSGLGSSVASSTNDKRAMMDSQPRSQKAKTQTVPAYRTRSVTASSTNTTSLSPRAVNRIQEHILRPLLDKPSLKPFEAIVLDVPRRIRAQEIICLRDVEKTLIFMAPVSQLETEIGVWGHTYRTLRMKEKAKSATLYLDFCLTSIRCVQATVEYLNENDQIRPDDRPYTNGYFIDLKEQLYQYGRQLATKEKGDDMDIDQYVPRFVPINQPTNPPFRGDEIRLHGGIAINGRPAELVRVKKDGTAISMATGEPVDLDEAPLKYKRSISQQLADDEEIMRSMARRKKNATPEELAPKQCREPGCNKEFKRPCDLTKHEKTHSRPFKCPFPTCKYHTFGWPTSKEMDRHVNDKHSDAPSIYECMFKPCPYKSKRESNCKQHMEKAHGWTYVRTKTNGKKAVTKPLTPPQETPQLGNMPTPSSTSNYSVPTPPQDEMLQGLPSDFPTYAGENAWLGSAHVAQPQLENMDMLADNQSPSSSASYEQYPAYQNGSTFILNDEDLYAARVQLPQQMPAPLYNKMMPQQMQQFPQLAQQQMMQQLVQPAMELPAHFSPAGQENAMLYTPSSLQEVDDVFEDPSINTGNDFQLFPVDLNKTTDFQPLFGMPSADLGFSQATQPDILQHIDWSNVDCGSFQE